MFKSLTAIMQFSSNLIDYCSVLPLISLTCTGLQWISVGYWWILVDFRIQADPGLQINMKRSSMVG